MILPESKIFIFNLDRLESYNLIQKFKSDQNERSEQLRIIFQLLTDPNDFIRSSSLGLFYDVLRVEWNNYSSREKEEVKSSLINLLASTKNVQRQMTRIIAEVAIREWPQEWRALSELIDTADGQYYLTILRITGEIQFHINHQTIDNQTRHRDLSTALGTIKRFQPIL